MEEHTDLNKNDKWYIFNLVGLQIEDQDNWLDFMFGDATIVNTNQLTNYFLEFNEGFNFLFPKNSTILLVQHEAGNESDKEADQKAELRALEVAGFIFFVFLFLSNKRYGICLDSQLYHNTSSTITTINSNLKISSYTDKFTKGEFLILIPPASFVYSRTELLEIFTKIQFKHLYEIVKGRKDTKVCKAIDFLYTTSNGNSPLTQFIGAVTALEVLLKKSQSEQYNIIKQRVRALLGAKMHKDFMEGNNGVTKKRNSVVHDGDYCTDKDVYRAITLVSDVIIAYSHIYQTYPSQNEICDYLDRVSAKGESDKSFDNNFMDWTVRTLTSYYKLCDPSIPHQSDEDYAKAIVEHSKVRNCELEQSYRLICQSLYYHSNPFTDFARFNSFYESHKDSIDNGLSGLRFIL